MNDFTEQPIREKDTVLVDRGDGGQPVEVIVTGVDGPRFSGDVLLPDGPGSRRRGHALFFVREDIIDHQPYDPAEILSALLGGEA